MRCLLLARPNACVHVLRRRGEWRSVTTKQKWLHVVGVTAAVLVGVHTSVWASQQRKEPVFAGVWLTTSIACGVASVVEELWANSLWKDLSSPAAWRSIRLALVLSVLGANVAMMMSLIVFNSAS